MSDPIMLEFDGSGIPKQLTWQARQWSVADTPTELEMDYFSMTHPLPGFEGWRFMGKNDAGITRVFDVLLRGDHWDLLRSYA